MNYFVVWLGGSLKYVQLKLLDMNNIPWYMTSRSVDGDDYNITLIPN